MHEENGEGQMCLFRMDVIPTTFAEENSSEDTNGTSGLRPQPHSQSASVLIVLVVSVIILVTIVGNVLVVVAVFTSRALRAPQNLFLVSLASADILVATLVIPFSLANEIMGYWYFGSTWCAFYLALDVLFCTSSIVHLCAISLDRYWSVTKAVRYNLKRTPNRIKCMIAVVWSISAVISFPPLIMTKHNEHECLLNNETWYILSSCMVSFFAPGIIMIMVYCKIYRVAKQRASTVFAAKNGVETQPSQSETCFVPRGKSEVESASSHNIGCQLRKGELDDIDLEETCVPNCKSKCNFSTRKVDGAKAFPKRSFRASWALNRNTQKCSSVCEEAGGVGGRLGARKRFFQYFQKYVPVVLDPNTSHPMLSLCDDLTTVRYGERQQYPDIPERFRKWMWVLGSEGFASGSHSWDVEVGDSTHWFMGVMRENAQIKETPHPDKSELYYYMYHYGEKNVNWWSVDCYDNKYVASSPSRPDIPIIVRQKPRRVRVQLDWDRGQLAFSDPDNKTHLHTFTDTFRETVFPCIFNGCDLHPVRIFPGKVSVIKA
ncbi:hypothetical protein DPEC_G00237070 [Dallia pectoralis]|uniref:Uncharacterized protein n=1 Tax=Dallia pectoralis TaxID=75939 RepID=A0ACC2FYW3_DALPE|nr:hypothetical protein DPEC_G00237070 [Dallia pectoralis]